MLVDYRKANICQTEGENILEHVSFQVNEGDFIYLIGRVGSGKSSLLKTIYCELDIDEAEKAEVLGQNLLEIRRKDIPALRKQMGIIFQDFQLLSDRTVHDNLEFVLKATGWKKREEREERFKEVLTDVGMQDFEDRMPHELSGGEQQRIAIARAILNRPKIIIADEPTGNLDPETASNIIQLLRDIAQTGTAIVMTTHNIQLLDLYPGIVYRCKDKKLEDITDNYNQMAADVDPNEPDEPISMKYAARADLSK